MPTYCVPNGTLSAENITLIFRYDLPNIPNNACENFNQVFVPQRFQRVHIIFSFYLYHNTFILQPKLSASNKFGLRRY